MGERANAALDRLGISFHVARLGEPHDRLDDGQRVARAVIDLAGEKRLAVFRFLAVGDVDGDAGDAGNGTVGVEGRGCAADTPALFAVLPLNEKFRLVEPRFGRRRAQDLLQTLIVFRAHERTDGVHGRRKAFGIDAEDTIVAFVPGPFARVDVVIP